MGRGTVILCVDDEERALLLRKLVLQKAGYVVVTASSAKQAIDILASRPIDVVVSDHLMPGITGAELARDVKAQYPRLPVALLSGLNDIPVDANFADVFISKLEGPDHLCSAIEALLSGPVSQKP